MNLRSSLSRFAFLASNFSSLGVASVTSPILARALSVSDRGMLAIALSLQAALIPVLSLGLPFLLRRAAFSDRNEARHILRQARSVAIISTPITCIATFTATLAFHELSIFERLAFMCAIGIAPAAAYRIASAGMLVASGATGAVSLLASLPGIAMLVGIVSLWILRDLSLGTAILVACSGILIQLPVGGYQLSRRGLSPLTTPRVGLKGLPMLQWILQILEMFVFRLDVLILGLFGGSRLAGLYAIASLPGTAAAAFSVSAMGIAIMKRPGPPALRAVWAVSVILFYGVVGWLLFGPVYALAIPLIFGDKYSQAQFLVPLAALASLASSINFVGIQALALDKENGHHRKTIHLLLIVILVALCIGVLNPVVAVASGMICILGIQIWSLTRMNGASLPFLAGASRLFELYFPNRDEEASSKLEEVQL